ncbi:unnamed protein product [Brassica oleracea]
MLDHHRSQWAASSVEQQRLCGSSSLLGETKRPRVQLP